MKRIFTALALAVLLPPAGALAWNNKGHMTVAYIAYENLKPNARKAVDELIRQHPDRARIADLPFSKCEGPADSYDYRRCLFVNAATWPDFIRNDPRFYDETDPHAEPTEELEGYPDMKVHKPWHFKDIPYTTDGSKVMWPGRINAETAIGAFRHSIGANIPAPRRAYFLSWLEHLVGDVHQPLHCISRFTKKLSPPAHPDGDRGGNEFLLKFFDMPESDYPAKKLHGLWDGALGAYTDMDSIKALAASTTAAHPKPANLSLSQGRWVRESFRLARDNAYSLSPCQGSNGYACVTPAYFSNAQAIARRRVALAGYRLAGVINARLN